MQASGGLGHCLAQHRLVARLSFRHRERCGRLILGGSCKLFCSRQHGEACFGTTHRLQVQGERIIDRRAEI